MEHETPQKIPRPEKSGLLGQLSKFKRVVRAGAFAAGLAELTDAVRPGQEKTVEDRARQVQDVREITQKKRDDEEEGGSSHSFEKGR